MSLSCSDEVTETGAEEVKGNSLDGNENCCENKKSSSESISCERELEGRDEEDTGEGMVEETGEVMVEEPLHCWVCR